MTRRGVRSQSGLMPSPAMYAQQVSAIFAFAVSGSPSFRNTSRSFCAFVRRYAEPSHRVISHVAQRSTTSIWVHPYIIGTTMQVVSFVSGVMRRLWRFDSGACVLQSSRCPRVPALGALSSFVRGGGVRPRIRWCGAIVFSSRR